MTIKTSLTIERSAMQFNPDSIRRYNIFTGHFSINFFNLISFPTFFAGGFPLISSWVNMDLCSNETFGNKIWFSRFNFLNISIFFSWNPKRVFKHSKFVCPKSQMNDFCRSTFYHSSSAICVRTNITKMIFRKPTVCT